jgi:hypothetical protein
VNGLGRLIPLLVCLSAAVLVGAYMRRAYRTGVCRTNRGRRVNRHLEPGAYWSSMFELAVLAGALLVLAFEWMHFIL